MSAELRHEPRFDRRLAPSMRRCLTIGACIAIAAAGSSQADQCTLPCCNGGREQVPTDDLLLESAPLEVAAVVHDGSQWMYEYASGSIVRTDWDSVWRPMCGSRVGALNRAGLLAAAARHEAQFQSEDPPTIVDTPRNGLAAGFDVRFSLPPDAEPEWVAACAQAEQFLESQFTDPIAVELSVSFDALPDGVLGATAPVYTTVSYKDSRNGLISGGDADDLLPRLLPAASKVSVRYKATSAVTKEDRIYWTRANYRATIGAVVGADAVMQFSDAVQWDFDPSDGVDDDATSFVDVLLHEVGHALGCVCGAGMWTKDMSSLDLFRFQYSDAGQDYNPDDAAEFTARPRLVAFNAPNDSHIVDFVTTELRMSDGSPYQASHLREQSPSLGLMDPALGAGVTRYPDYFSTADLMIFDAIGWDR